MSRSVKEQIENRCVNFTGMMNKECEEGIKYEDVQAKAKPPFRFKVPCFQDGAGSCAFCRFPTPEEVEKEVEEIRSMTANMLSAYSAVKAHYEEHKKRRNTMDCPECKAVLTYTVAGVNGHIWAKCSGCEVGWME